MIKIKIFNRATFHAFATKQYDQFFASFCLTVPKVFPSLLRVSFTHVI